MFGKKHAAESGKKKYLYMFEEGNKDMRELLGPDALIVTPGVRPVGAALGDQSRVATPSQAIERGASHIVVGRPITGADDPVAAFDAIVAELVENVA